MYIIVGLGNPGEEYKETRHNVGRIVVDAFCKKNNFPALVFDKKLNALKTEGKIGKEPVTLIEPETFMNKSGNSIKLIIKSKKAAERLVVVHDDLDLPLGRIKVSFKRGSGGHKGVESIIRAIKTEDFIRLRVGISGRTSKGQAKKPDPKKILDFIIGPFKKPEMELMKKTAKTASSALEEIIMSGKEAAMGEFNQ